MTASRTLVGTAARASLATAFIACGATADFTGMSTEASLVDQTGWTTPDARLYVISSLPTLTTPTTTSLLCLAMVIMSCLLKHQTTRAFGSLPPLVVIRKTTTPVSKFLLG